MKIHLLTEDSLDTQTLGSIQKGDIYFLLSKNSLSIGMMTEETVELYSTDKVIGIKIYQHLKEPNVYVPSTIFCYNGTERRKGDINVLLNLQRIVLNIQVKQILQEVINILLFKEDRINLQYLIPIISLPIIRQENVKEITKKTISQIQATDETKSLVPTSATPQKVAIRHRPDEFLFFNYITPEDKKIWHELYLKGSSQRNIYQYLKSNSPSRFKKSLRKFLENNPQYNIYSLGKPYEISNDIAKEGKCFYRNVTFDFVYKELERKGFIQSDDEVWKDSNGKEYIISIHSK